MHIRTHEQRVRVRGGKGQGYDGHLWQQFKNRMGPVRSVFCEADTPPNRSPPGLLLRWVGRYKNRSSASSIQTLFPRGFGNPRICCHPGRVIQPTWQSPNERSTMVRLPVLDGHHCPLLLLISLFYSGNRIDLCKRYSTFNLYLLVKPKTHLPTRIPTNPPPSSPPAVPLPLSRDVG